MKKLYPLVLVLLLVSLSGCVDPEAVLTLERVDGSDGLAESASTNATNFHSGVLEAVKNGSSEPTVRDTDFDRRAGLVEYKGSYYNISKKIVGETESKFATFNITKTTRNADYDLDELPKKDAEPIRDYIEHQRKEYSPELRIGQRYSLDDINESVLLEERRVVVSANGENYLVDVTDVDNRSESLFVYNASMEFNSSENYGEYLRDEFAFTLDSLPENSTSVWEKALNSRGYYGEQTDGYEELRDRFVSEKAFDRNENSGTWFVRYNGNLYRAELSWIPED